MRSLSLDERGVMRDLFFDGATPAERLTAVAGVIDELRELGLVAGPRDAVVLTEAGARLCFFAADTQLVRYREVTDNDSHHYLIPDNRTDEWDAWLEIPSDDERSWDVPEFAHAIDGGCLTFTQPMIGSDFLP